MHPDTNPEEITVHNPLHTMQEGEKTLGEIRRHPIGIIYLYMGVGITLALLTYVVYGILPSAAGGEASLIGTVILIIMSVLGVAFAFACQIIYWGNRWVLTSDSVTEIQQTGLFNKQASQFSLENIEDVTSIKKGILAHIFNYGNLKAQTAGEHEKFILTYCPDPDNYARIILHAREQFILNEKKHGPVASPQPTL